MPVILALLSIGGFALVVVFIVKMTEYLKSHGMDTDYVSVLLKISYRFLVTVLLFIHTIINCFVNSPVFMVFSFGYACTLVIYGFLLISLFKRKEAKRLWLRLSNVAPIFIALFIATISSINIKLLTTAFEVKEKSSGLLLPGVYVVAAVAYYAPWSYLKKKTAAHYFVN